MTAALILCLRVAFGIIVAIVCCVGYLIVSPLHLISILLKLQGRHRYVGNRS